MKRPRQDQTLSTVDTILSAAVDVIVEKGFVGTTLDLVAARAGCSKVTVLYHFKGREALMERALEVACEEWRGWLIARANSAAGDQPPLLGLFDVLDEWFREDFRGSVLLIAATELRPRSERAQAIIDDYLRAMHGALAEMARQAGSRRPDATAAAIELLIRGALASAMVSRSGDFAQEAKRVAALLLAQDRK